MLMTAVKSSSFRPVRWVMSAASVAALVACGGGGGGGTTAAPVPTPSTPSTTTFPLKTAIANYVNLPVSTTYTIGGTAVQGTQTFNASGSGTVVESTTAGTFEGVAALKKSLSNSFTLVSTNAATGQSGSTPSSSVSNEFYDSNYAFLGATSSTSYCVATSSPVLPSTIRVGDSGTFATSACFADSTKRTRTNNTVLAYSLASFNESTALITLQSSSTDASTGAVTLTRSIYRVSTSGAMTHHQDTSSGVQNGVTVNLTLTYP